MGEEPFHASLHTHHAGHLSFIMTATTTTVSLISWGRSIDRTIRAGQMGRAISMADLVLQQRRRHLPTYQRLIEALWQLRRWEEAGEWGRRLLHADPGNGPAWRAVARQLEAAEERGHAQVAWRRAFECDPFDPAIRVGLNRTNLGQSNPLRLNQAALARLHLRGYHWRQAAGVYGELVETNPQRSDYLVGWALALWRHGRHRDAYHAARYATQHFPHILIPWAILADLGDANDRALAQNPLETMDPDGEFVGMQLRLDNAPPQERSGTTGRTPRPTLIHVPADQVPLEDDRADASQTKEP